MRRLNLRSQQGAAIIVALFVMALVAACAAAMMFRLNVDVERTELILNADKATLYAQGSVDWAIEQLKADYAKQKPNQLIDRLPISISNKTDGYTITSTLEDMQNKFNLNDLKDSNHQDFFNRLLHLLKPDMEMMSVAAVTQAIVDWTQPGSKDSTLAAYYEKQAYPYQAPHKPMVSVSELRLVRGITPAIYEALLPYVTALPQGAKLNVNNTPWEVLYSMAPLMSQDAAKAIELHCKQTPFGSIQEFTGFDIVKNNPLPADAVDVTSSYFLVKTSVKVGTQEIKLFTMLQRIQQQNGKADVKIVWQTKGTV